MRRFTRSIHITLGDTTLVAKKIVLPDDGSDVRCPSCQGERFTEIYSVIQYGFENDDCLDIFQCIDCLDIHYVQYVRVNTPEGFLLTDRSNQ